MGISVMVLGNSGTGKSCSLRNFNPDEICLINVAGKPLPFRGKIAETHNTNDYAKVVRYMERTDKKIIIIDDAQYLMIDEFMRRALERGYEKFTEIAQHFNDLLKLPKDLPSDVIVYFLAHTETSDDGVERLKTVGKLVSEKVVPEGLCTIVLKTGVSDGQYTFQTQNSGHDTCKSPMGMFDSYLIDNDLKFVDDCIRNYYTFEDAKSDDEIKSAAKGVAVSDEKPVRTRRSRRAKTEDEPEPEPASEVVEESKPAAEPEEKPVRSRRKRKEREVVPPEEHFDISTDDLPF